MGRSHDQQGLLVLGSHPGDVPHMIARLHRFFESGVLLTVDPDEADRVKREKHGRPRTDDH
jgi:hypothetical protein